MEKLINRRAFLSGLGTAVIGVLGCESKVPEKPLIIATVNPTVNEPRRNLEEITQADFSQIAIRAVDNYQRILGINIDKKAALEALTYLPNLSSLSQEERDTFCSNFPCGSAAGYYSRLTGKMYVSKDNIDAKYLATITRNPNSPPALVRSAIEAYTQQIILHELTHYTASVYPVQEGELDNLIRNYFGEEVPGIRNKALYISRNINGLAVDYERSDKPGAGAIVFRGLEEALAIVTELYVSNTVVTDKRLIVIDNYFAQQRDLLKDLLLKLSPNDYGRALKTILNFRSQPNSLEKFIQYVGQTFEKDEAKQFETGFKILYAVDHAKQDLYKELTTHK